MSVRSGWFGHALRSSFTGRSWIASAARQASSWPTAAPRPDAGWSGSSAGSARGVTVGEPVRRWVSWFSCAVSRATSFSRKSPPPRIMWHSRTSGQPPTSCSKADSTDFLLAVQAHDGEEGDLPAELLRIGVGVIAADHAGLLQPAHAAQAGRRGDAGPARQLDVGHPAVGLKLRQDATVDRVQDGRIGCGALHPRNITARPLGQGNEATVPHGGLDGALAGRRAACVPGAAGHRGRAKPASAVSDAGRIRGCGGRGLALPNRPFVASLSGGRRRPIWSTRHCIGHHDARNPPHPRPDHRRRSRRLHGRDLCRAREPVADPGRRSAAGRSTDDHHRRRELPGLRRRDPGAVADGADGGAGRACRHPHHPRPDRPGRFHRARRSAAWPIRATSSWPTR